MTNDGFEFLLPGSWRHIPVRDAEAARNVIRRYTVEAVGRGDDSAALRAEIRARFEAALDRARAANADRLWLCTEIMPGVPLPCSITAYFPALAARSSADGSVGVEGLHRLLGAPPEGVEDTELEVAGRPAIRRAQIVVGPAGAEPGAPESETLEADYWILRPDGRRVLLLSFACGLPLLRDRLTELFDLIVATLHWTEAPTRAAQPAPPAPASAVEPLTPFAPPESTEPLTGPAAVPAREPSPA